MVNPDKLNELAQNLGILTSFTDYGTNVVYTADERSKQVICQALGYAAGTDEEIDASLKQLAQESFLTPVTPTDVVYPEEISPFVFDMSLPKSFETATIAFELHREEENPTIGSFHFSDMPFIAEQEIDGTIYQKRRVYLFLTAPLGYHRLRFVLPDETAFEKSLIVAPRRCYEPPFESAKRRVFGFPIQVYALHSAHSWGIGDFSDVAALLPLVRKTGADFIGVNPLNALFADSPQDASPYCASSRLFLNPLYVNLETVPEMAFCPAAQALIESPAFQAELTAVRTDKQVRYPTVAHLKKQVLSLLYETFKEQNQGGQTERAKAFASFCAEKGDALELFAVYHLLRVHFMRSGESAIWWEWPAAYQDVSSDAVAQFKAEHWDEIGQILYEQFVVHEQFEALVAACEQSEMAVGLYTDLPVGVCANSAEVWSDQTVFMRGVTTGAPPDVFNRDGQDWALAPFNPKRLAETGFQAYREVIDRVMTGAGAVRIDHAFGLERLYLRVPDADGAYLRYPFKALLGIVALESVRHRCLVIAEDLGTAPEGFADRMVEANALSFRILHFQHTGSSLVPPQHYPYQSFVATGTHDLPSYTAYWKELDLALALRMNTITEDQYGMHQAERKADKSAFVELFRECGYPMKAPKAALSKPDVVPDWFIENAYRLLAETNSVMAGVRFEDLLAQDEQVNLPGTNLEYPNWRYKLPLSVEEMSDDPRIDRICALVRDYRRKDIE